MAIFLWLVFIILYMYKVQQCLSFFWHIFNVDTDMGSPSEDTLNARVVAWHSLGSVRVYGCCPHRVGC